MKQTQIQLWRVEWTHKAGYQAPHQYVEAETREKAVKLQKKSTARLMDFPESWSWQLVNTGLSWNNQRNVWSRD